MCGHVSYFDLQILSLLSGNINTILERYDELAKDMREMLHVKEEEYVKQVEEAKRHMDEASAFIAAKLKEQHQAMFKVLFAATIISSLFRILWPNER